MPEKNKLTRKERLHLFHRREILSAALHLFAEKGFHNVTMQQIATLSEFSVGSLYNFFPNKEALYKALIHENAEAFHHALKTALETPGSECDKIRAWLEQKIVWFNKNLEFVHIYFAENLGVSVSVKESLIQESRDLYRDITRQIATVFESGIQKKIFRKMDPYLLGVSISGMSNAILLEQLEARKDLNVNADLILEMFFEPIRLERGTDDV